MTLSHLEFMTIHQLPPNIITWENRLIEELSKEELLKVIQYLSKSLNYERERSQQERRMMDLFRSARKRG